jgi:hypothetical protein
MSHWKGQRVRIKVVIPRGKKVHEAVTYLDTDTMADLMDRFSPDTHAFLVRPLSALEVEALDE